MNKILLKDLFSEKAIALEDDEFLWQDPRLLPTNFSYDRIAGMLLGLAIGDSLGNTSEGMNPDDRDRLYGQITDYLPNRYADWKRVGVPSDDTQMAFWTIEVLLEDGCLIPDHLTRRFAQERIFGIGKSVREFLSAYKVQGKNWRIAGTTSAGNGAIMRIAPVVLPYLKKPDCDLWADAALAGMVTHNDRASNAACVAFSAMLWDLFGMQTPPEEDWWLERYCQVAEPLEGNQTMYSPRLQGLEYNGPVWRFTRDKVQTAMNENWSTIQAGNTWGSGAYLLETIPTTLYILMKYGRDPEQAIIHAVNDTRDNDTIAAMVGAIMGALYGRTALPSRWIDDLLGRTNDNDDGKVFELIGQARSKFWGED